MLHDHILSKHAAFLGILVVVSLTFRLPGVPWGVVNGDYFEPDERQHIGIAKHLIHRVDPSLVRATRLPFQLNARGFAVQLGLLALVAGRLGLRLSDVNMVMLGRCLSVFYGTLLVIALYVFFAFILRDSTAGFLSGLLLAGSDLHVTYSHYALPEVPHAFWFFVSVMLLVRYHTGRPTRWITLGLGITLGLCVAFKLDVVPSLTFGLLLLLQRQRAWQQRVVDLSYVTLVAVCTLLLSWATLDVDRFVQSAQWVWRRNYDAVVNGNHLLYNPVLYFAAVVAGTSAPAFCASVLGIRDSVRSTDPLARRTAFVLLLASLLFFIAYWLGDATFVRRASVFVPVCALFGGLSLTRLWRRGRLALMVPLIIGYTFALTGISQQAFVNDTRYQARTYLDSNWPEQTGAMVVYDQYSRAAVRHRANGISIQHPRIANAVSYADVGLVVLHETYYGRYVKYFTTPFGIPESCDDVYHCKPGALNVVQGIIFNRTPLKLLKRYEVWHPFPERIAFKALFGTYETFVGDVLIYGMPEYVQ